MFKKAIIASSVALVLAGCTTRLGDFTVASTKNINIKTANHTVDTSERITGEDTKKIIVIIPTGVPSVEEAMDRAIESREGAVALSNVTVTQKQFYIPYIYGETSFIVEGNPVYEKK